MKMTKFFLNILSLINMGENSKQSVYSTCNVSGMQNHLLTLCRASLKAELPETHLDLHLVI